MFKYLNPKKYINFFKQYPRLQNLLKLNNRTTRLMLMNYYFNLVKKNKNLKNFFLDGSNEINQINFKIEELYNENNLLFKSLAHNGIVIVENVLSFEEKQKVLNFFSEIEKKNISSDWIDKSIIDSSSIKYKDSNKVKISCMKKNIKYLPSLSRLNDYVTKKIFGKKISTVAEFFLHECIDTETPDSYEDTKFHIDRYLPCLKIIYTPNKINEASAPFGFIKKTHKLNNEFMRNFTLNSKKFFIDDEHLTLDLKNNEVSTICPENSLIISFTNGFHKRNIFLKKNVRKMIFFQFTNNFNFFSLLNYKKYN